MPFVAKTFPGLDSDGKVKKSIKLSRSEKKQLAVVEKKQKEIAEEQTNAVLSGQVSIWDMPAFPNKTRPCNFTPQNLRDALTEYETTPDNIVDVLDRRGIRVDTFYDLLSIFPEIREVYELSRAHKSVQYAKVAQNIYQGDIPETFFEIDKNGCKRLSMAGIRYLRDKAEIQLRFAEIHETGSFVRRSQVETKSMNLNVNANIDIDPSSINSMNPNDILGALFQGGKSVSK